MMNRGDLSDEQWERFQPFYVPQKPRTGKLNHDHHWVINGILWILRTGALWSVSYRQNAFGYAARTQTLRVCLRHALRLRQFPMEGDAPAFPKLTSRRDRGKPGVRSASSSLRFHKKEEVYKPDIV